MKVGFTGTREGLTDAQKKSLADWLYEKCFYGTNMTEFHHGVCVGADAWAAVVIDDESPMPQPSIHAHLADVPGAMIDGNAVACSTVHHKAKPPLDRNRDIVNACEVLLACPKGPEEQRSGTWSTVRYARKQKVKVVIFWPDGEVTVEGGGK